MRIVSLEAAKTHLSRLIERTCAGEEIVTVCNDHES